MLGSNSLDQLRPNFGGMVLGRSPSKIVSDSPDLQPTWSLLLKIKNGKGDHQRIILAKLESMIDPVV
jgi:hypothetical protein